MPCIQGPTRPQRRVSGFWRWRHAAAAIARAMLCFVKSSEESMKAFPPTDSGYAPKDVEVRYRIWRAPKADKALEKG
jgi:hypothetical protein